MKSGIYHALAEAVYRADPAISQSALKVIARSPAHFKAGVEAEEKEETSAMLLGRVAGQMVLEPDREAWWTVVPQGLKFNTKKGLEWAREQCAWRDEVDGEWPDKVADAFDKKGISVLSHKDFKRASEMAGVLADSPKPEVRQLLGDSDYEVSGFADVETPSGIVPCKFRADIVPRGSNVLADLKTCQSATPKDFLYKSVLRLKYHVQASSYLKLWNLAAGPQDQRSIFWVLAIESTPPYAHQVFRFDESFLRLGSDLYEQYLATYALCKKLDQWDDYPAGVLSLMPPDRELSRIE